MKGKLYGVGVGPGDPELLTCKAVRIMEESDVIVVPGQEPKQTVAYQIAAGGTAKIKDKPLIGVHMPMTKDPELLKSSHKQAVEPITALLDEGKQVVFLTLGDPCIYSTYIYIHKAVRQAGYETELINGIPSFLAVSARLNEGLVEAGEMLHIIPASYDIEAGIKSSGTKVIMKAGSQMKQVKQAIIQAGLEGKAMERCMMEGEQIYESIEAIPDHSSYYSLIIVKEQGGT